MKPIISLERRDAILDLANKRTQIVCALMEGNHVDGLDEILRFVDRPVGTPEEIRNAPEDRHVNAISAWYDLIANACRWLQNIGLTMTDHVPVYWFDAATSEIQWTYADELVFCLDEQDVEYKGQQLFASAIDYFGIEVCERLREALLDCDTERADRLMAIINHAMKEYI